MLSLQLGLLFMWSLHVCQYVLFSLLEEWESLNLKPKTDGGFHIALRLEWQCQVSSSVSITHIQDQDPGQLQISPKTVTFV